MTRATVNVFRIYFLLTLSCGFVFSAEPAPRTKDQALPGRSKTNVVVRIKGKGKYTMTFPAHPYVDANGAATILPGEKYIIEFDVKDGQPVNPTCVTNRTAGKDCLILEFKNDGDVAMLIRSSDCSKPLSMKCRYQQVADRNFYTTELCTLMPTDCSEYYGSADSWGPEVIWMMLYDFKFLDDDIKAPDHNQ